MSAASINGELSRGSGVAGEVARRLATSKPPSELVVKCVQAGGFRRAVRLLEFVWAWWLTEDVLGRRVGIEEFAETWEASTPTAYRRQVEFRAAFPGLSTPADLPRA